MWLCNPAGLNTAPNPFSLGIFRSGLMRNLSVQSNLFFRRFKEKLFTLYLSSPSCSPSIPYCLWGDKVGISKLHTAAGYTLWLCNFSTKNHLFNLLVPFRLEWLFYFSHSFRITTNNLPIVASSSLQETFTSPLFLLYISPVHKVLNLEMVLIITHFLFSSRHVIHFSWDDFMLEKLFVTS